MPRPLYRLRQFWLALQARPAPADLLQAQAILSPAEFALFTRLQPSEQAHAILVWRKMLAQAPDLPRPVQEAALLHDIGKVRCPLRLWERVVIVIGQAAFPQAALRWGAHTPRGLFRPFVVACQHPRWGAELAQDCGAGPLTLALIARHADPLPPADSSPAGRWLPLLQLADNDS